MGQETYKNQQFTKKRLLEFTNKERSIKDLKKLKVNEKLNKSASKKCKDMIDKDYWSHTSPSGEEPWEVIEDFVEYEHAGENLAYGFISEQAVVNGWMNSKGHRENLLNENYTEVGFAYCTSDNYQDEGKNLVVVQHFISPSLGVNRSAENQTPATTVQPYIASVCKKKVIRYKTIYKDDPYMYVGETDEYGGHNGYVQTCTADSTGYKPADFTIDPIDKTVYRGTKQIESSTSAGLTYQQAYNTCSAQGVPPNSSAMELCIEAYLD